MTEAIRLAKRLAAQLACSRSEAEQFITGGWVRVDGQVVEEPQFRVLPTQSVEVSPDATSIDVAPVTLLLHKPAEISVEGSEGNAQPAASGMTQAAGYLQAGNQLRDDRSGIRPLKKHFSALEMVTPLAFRASGLVVFTQDFRVARKLRDDARLIEHEVIVQVAGTPPPGALERLNRVDHGFTFNGALLPPVKASWQSEQRLRFAVKGERPGQLAYFCECVGLQVEAMKRMRIGRVPLGSLPVGQWRYLLPQERF